jgi:hypothetical protein
VGIVRETVRDLPPTEHGDRGFLVAAGPSFRPGATLDGAHVVDIAPTLLHLMGREIPADMDGHVLTALLEAQALAANPVRRASIEWSDEPW